MWLAIKHGFRNSFNVNGRDSRQTFWYYVLFVYILTIVISSLATIPAMFNAIIQSVRDGIANPENAQQAQNEAVLATMNAMVPITIWVGLATGLLLLIVLAASFVRRLHDSGLSGLWGLLPAALQVASLSLLPFQADQLREDMVKASSGDPLTSLNVLESSLNFGAIAGWGAIILVIVLGARKSSAGPNKFGNESFDVVEAEAQLRADGRRDRQ